MAKQMKNKIRQKIGAVFQPRRRSDERSLSVSEVELVDRNVDFHNGGKNPSPDVESNGNQIVLSALCETENTRVLKKHGQADKCDARKQISNQGILDKSKRLTKSDVKDKQEKQQKSRRDKKTADFMHTADLNIICIFPSESCNTDITEASLGEDRSLKTETDIVKTAPIALLQKPSGKLDKKEKRRKKKSRDVTDKHSSDKICSANEGKFAKKKSRKQRKNKKADDGMVVSISEGSFRTDKNDYYKDANNKFMLVSETLLLPVETITSQVSSWIAESKFSDCSDDENIQKQKSRRQKKEKKKRRKGKEAQLKCTDENLIATSEDIPSLMECKEEYCIQYKCIPELKVCKPKEIMVLKYCNDNGSIGKPDIQDNIFNIKKETIFEYQKTSLDLIENNNTQRKSKLRKTNDETDKHTSVVKSDVRDGKEHDQTLSYSSMQPRYTQQRHHSFPDDVDKRCVTNAFQDSKKQEHVTDALLRRLEIFTGIVLEEELKLQIYETNSKLEAEAKFNQLLDNIVQHVLELNRRFQERLNAIHLTNLEKIDKEIRVCKMVMAGSMSVVEQSQSSRPSDNESQSKEKSAVYEEILWRSFKNCRRYDYETVLHPGIESLMFNTDKRDFGVLGHCQLIDQRIGRPVSIIEEGKAVDYPVELGEKLTYSIHHHLDEKVSNITGCAFLDDGCLVMADNNNSCIKLVSTVNSVAQRKELENTPLDVCVLKTNHIAVTVPIECRVYMLRYLGLDNEMEIDSSFETGSQCFGISVVNGVLIVTCQSKDGITHVKSFTKDGHLLAFFQNDQNGYPLFQCPRNISASLDNTQVFVSDTDSNTVIGLTLTGCITFRYGHKDLRDISALCAFDTYSFMVCDKQSRNVHLVSNSGEFIQTLIEHDDNIQNVSMNADNRVFITIPRNDMLSTYKLVDITK